MAARAEPTPAGAVSWLAGKLWNVVRGMLLAALVGAAVRLAYLAKLRERVDATFPGPRANVLLGNVLDVLGARPLREFTG